MNVLTKAQRVALKRVFDRQELTAIVDKNGRTVAARWANYPSDYPIMTYREFRTLVHVGFDCVMVPWCGMWLGIETDGYTHS